MNNREQIGSRIREIRMKQGLSVEDLAKKTGLLYANIVRIETGRYAVNIDILQIIASALNCTVKIIENQK